jgi:hypothetical protein
MRTLQTSGPIDLAYLALAAHNADLERSRQALAEDRRRQAERDDAIRSDRAARLLEVLMGNHLIPDETDGALIRVGSLWFTAETDEWGRYRLWLITRCRSCRMGLYRHGFASLKNLGAILAAVGEHDDTCTFCRPSSLPYLRSFDADAAYEVSQ